MSYRSLSLLAALGPVVCVTAHAEIYMTEEQAATAIFPKEQFEKKSFAMSDEDKAAIEKVSGENVRSNNLKYFKSKEGSLVFVDQVLGKHEFITMAVGINKEGKVQGVEIIEYRESYGQGVVKPTWRQQFVGKAKGDPLRVEKDIKNISGATLSSVHVTGGVRRLLQSYDQIKSRI